MTVFSALLNICLPIFVIIGIGWSLDRAFRFDITTLVRLNLYIFVPAFIFVSLVNSELDGDTTLGVVLFTTIAIAIAFFLCWGIGAAFRLEKRRTIALQVVTMFYNCGNYGIPLMALAYPQTGPPLQAIVIVTMNVAQFTVGIALTSRSSAQPGDGFFKHWLPVLRQASLWAIVAAILVRQFEIPVQEWTTIWIPLEYMAQAIIALALVTLGVQLSKTGRPHTDPLILTGMAIRLVIIPLLSVPVALLLGFRGDAAEVLILSTTVPTAVNAAMIMHELKGDSEFGASAVFLSTALSLVTVTTAVVVLRAIGG